MFTCLNDTKPRHQHETVYEAKVCYGFIQTAPAVPVHHDWKDAPGSMTRKQHGYIMSLDADAAADAVRKQLSCNQASHLIDVLKKAPVTTTPTPAEQPEDPRLKMVKGMIDMVPSGYFAVRPDSTVNYSFIRVSIPKTGRFKGCTKIQTQHSDDYRVEAVIWPSGRWSIYRNSIIDDLLLLVVDFQGAAMAYAHEIGKCCRCNKALTDERSRYYGVGPECEQYWPWVTARIDEAAGHTYHPGVTR